MKQGKYGYLLNQYSIIIGIYTNLDDLCNSIKEQIVLVSKQIQTFSFFAQHERLTKDLSKESAQFLWLQVFNYVIARLPRNQQAKEQMIQMCKEYYRGNRTEIKLIEEFEQHYKAEDAIRWYSKQSFIYKLVNKALRTEDIELLYKFRFFIGDLSESLQCQHKNIVESEEQILNVYRGTTLDREEVQKLKQNKEKLISTNGYLSTSRDRSLALSFALKPTKRIDVVSTLFHIQCHIKEMDENIIFADISEYDKSQNYFQQLVTDPNDEDQAWIEYNIGRALLCKGELYRAREYYDRAYDRMMKNKPARIKDSAHVLSDIGDIL
ncbi:unnamed protein product, partial [Rotaria sp. Silwood1]